MSKKGHLADPSLDDNFCVYVHRRKDNGEVIYVGEGRSSRAQRIGENSGKNNAYYKIAKDVGVYWHIVQDNLTKDETIEFEASLINYLEFVGTPITNMHKRSPRGYTYLREDFEDKMYVDPTSPSGLRWKTDRRNMNDRGTLLARKGDIVGGKNNKSGYWCTNGKLCHRIVYALTYGECPGGLTVDHLDGNKDNNSVVNLELVSLAENSRRANAKRESPKGEDCTSSKVTADDILEMYRMFSDGKTNKEVGDTFGLHDRYISLVRHGKRWRHLYDLQEQKFPDSYTYGSSSNYSQIKQAYLLIRENTKTNKEISNLTGVEVSQVSRMRHGKAYTSIIEKIEKELKGKE